MIVALPCLQFSSRERAIIKQINKCILTFPEFHDNYYVRYKRFRDVNWRKLFLKSIARHREHLKFIVYPDGQGDMVWLLDSFSDVEFIYPLHFQHELDFVLKHGFKWLGMPNRAKWRDYSIQWFIEVAEKYGYRKWYLGWWNERNYYWLKEFNGLDTTLPEYYAYKTGKIWYAPHRARKPREEMRAIDIFKVNVENFTKWITRYLGGIECP